MLYNSVIFLYFYTLFSRVAYILSHNSKHSYWIKFHYLALYSVAARY